MKRLTEAEGHRNEFYIRPMREQEGGAGRRPVEGLIVEKGWRDEEQAVLHYYRCG